MRIIRNYDVASYYPHLMTINGYLSRSIADPKEYAEMLERRMQAKKSGDKKTANALKLIANTTYGATLNKYNDLYDPLKARSVCISGQLYLLELSYHLLHDVPDLLIVQTNTDGIMIEFDESQLDLVHSIVNEWQLRTGFELEEDIINVIAQSNVNNYVEINNEGAKYKGGFLVRGIAPAGAFNINNNAVIVATALKKYFTEHKPLADTINECDDPFQFQIIAKAGSSYKEVLWDVGGEMKPVQRVNRIFAVKDSLYGKVYKVKDGANPAMIQDLPEHCWINNKEASCPLDLLDKNFYIVLAEQKLNKFLKVKKPKLKGARKMPRTTKQPEEPTTENVQTEEVKEKPDYSQMNVYKKLSIARNMFYSMSIKKTGYHEKPDYYYFTLEDIVPPVTKIFAEIGLVHHIIFPQKLNEDQTARLVLVNVDKPDDQIWFLCPMDDIEPILNSAGKPVTQAIQRRGAQQTYIRRYLMLQLMDVVQYDEVDGAQKQPADKPKMPASPERRQEVVAELTAPENSPTELQVKQLKKGLVKLLKLNPEEQPYVDQIALDTNGLTTVTKEQCEAYMLEVSAKIESAEKTAGGATNGVAQ